LTGGHRVKIKDREKIMMERTKRKLRHGLFLSLGLGFGNVVWGSPTIQSVDVSPNPLATGQNFTITVAASTDATQAVATVDFRPAGAQTLQIPLSQQGSVWTGSGLVPAGLSDKANAKVKVVLSDAANHHSQQVVQADVIVSSITAVFAAGILTVTGDDHDNTLIVSRDIAGNILVNGGVVPVTGGVPTVANTSLVRILGLGGNDVLTVDDANGPMPPGNLLGGDGDDVLTGSAADDLLDGGPGNDTLIGRGGNDVLIGGPGNDILIGGPGEDQIVGGEGDDQIIWNPGDGSDVVEGGDGTDTLVFNGSNIGENVDLSPNGQRLRFSRNIANVTMDCNGIERVIFHALSGADQVVVNDLTGTQVSNVVVDLSSSLGAGDGAADTVIVNGTETNDVITVTGSTNGVDVLGLSASVRILGSEPGLDSLVVNALGGDDRVDASALQANTIELTLNGGSGNDLLIGSEGDDVLIGGQGNDVMFGGPGDDTFVWSPGDGSDVIEGQAGQDTLIFNGANIGEVIDLSANGQRLRFSRNVANITMDCAGIETVQFNALGGADTITVNDLTGTGVTNVSLDLATPPGSGQGDGAADSVIVKGTDGNDVITVAGDSAGVTVQGLAATVNIVGSEATLDQLRIDALAGDDVVSAEGLQAGAIKLTIDGGPGNDVLIGSAGDDELFGGDGDDILEGGPGLDVLDGGAGNNVLIQD
jgi:Ca2+-binding RTX toxin-like protein